MNNQTNFNLNTSSEEDINRTLTDEELEQVQGGALGTFTLFAIGIATGVAYDLTKRALGIGQDDPAAAPGPELAIKNCTVNRVTNNLALRRLNIVTKNNKANNKSVW